MTLYTIHGVSNNFSCQLFALFSLHLLPGENRLPKNYHATKSMIRKLGLNYNTIHTCEGGCVLNRGPYVNDVHFPKCNKTQYKDKEEKKPCKILRHFPLIPRLKNIYFEHLQILSSWFGIRRIRAHMVWWDIFVTPRHDNMFMIM